MQSNSINTDLYSIIYEKFKESIKPPLYTSRSLDYATIVISKMRSRHFMFVECSQEDNILMLTMSRFIDEEHKTTIIIDLNNPNFSDKIDYTIKKVESKFKAR